MGSPLIGKIQIEDTPNKMTTIVLNGDTGAVVVGSQGGIIPQPPPLPPGHDGRVSVNDAVGTECGNLGASGVGGVLVLNYHDGTPGAALGRGFQGDPGPSLFMLEKGEIRVRLQGLSSFLALGGGTSSDAQIGLFPNGAPNGPPEQSNVLLRASDATIRAGGAGTAGRLLVLGKGGTDKSQIELDGATGNIRATGDIFLPGADFAEDFDIVAPESAEPGTVMVIDEGGVLRQSEVAYDKKVAGVISGAGACRPGIVLDKQSGVESRATVALVGKVFCKVDAGYSSIEVGDLLTTSQTPGHAMKASDPLRAFGCVIGKALHPLHEGRSLIPILIALQ